MLRTLYIVAWLVGLAAISSQRMAGQGALADVLSRVGAALEHYYARAQSVMCTETITLQNLGYDQSNATPFARRLVYDLRVSWEPPPSGDAPEARVQRDLVRVNGRVPRAKDKPSCTDPSPVSPDSLEMLLPTKQSDYIFSMVGPTKLNGRQAIQLDYRPRQAGPVTVKAFEGREECYQVDMPGRTRGRVWIDVETASVLRLDERLTGFVEVRIPPNGRTSRVPLDVIYERLDSSIVYRPVTFTEPDETLMLPASSEAYVVARNSGVPRQRRSQRFTNYQRFRTEGRLVQQ